MNNKILWACLLSLTLMTQACAVESKFEKYMNRGSENYDKQNYNLAIKDFNSAIKYEARSYQAYCMLGLSYGASGNLDKAESAFENAIKISPQDWQAYTFLGDTMRFKKDYPKAAEYYKKAVSLNSMQQDGKVYYQKILKELYKEQKNVLEKNRSLHHNFDDVKLNLDPQKWQKVTESGNNEYWIVEYGLKGERVETYEWTKLITVQYYSFEVLNVSPYQHMKNFIKEIEKLSKNIKKSFTNTIITQSPAEVIYEWSFGDNEESEISRIIKNKKGMYHIHFAKKGAKITAKERKNWLAILKNAEISE